MVKKKTKKEQKASVPKRNPVEIRMVDGKNSVAVTSFVFHVKPKKYRPKLNIRKL